MAGHASAKLCVSDAHRTLNDSSKESRKLGGLVADNKATKMKERAFKITALHWSTKVMLPV